MNSIYREYEMLKSGQMLVFPTDQIDPSKDYLQVMNEWEGDQISQMGYDSVRDITNTEKRNNKSRLAIRLAILQSFTDLDADSLTLDDLREYWKGTVPGKLRHPKSKSIYKPHMMNPMDVASMAGFHTPKIPSRHPNPPIRLVPIGELKSNNLSRGGAVTIPLSPEDERAELSRVEYGLNTLSAPAEKEALVKVRLLQGYFRQVQLRQWQGRCAVSGVENSTLLVLRPAYPEREIFSISRDLIGLQGYT